MASTLHITNGDSAAAVMRRAGFSGEILPWRDVLHEGPVSALLPLTTLSPLRAHFIAEAGHTDLKEHGFAKSVTDFLDALPTGDQPALRAFVTSPAMLDIT